MSIEAMEQAANVLESILHVGFERYSSVKISDTLHMLLRTIAEAKKQEPVGEVVLWRGEKQAQWEQSLPVGTKFYIHPQPKREPLTEEQIRTQFCGKPENFWDYYAGVRYAEAAHGIKESQ